MKTFEETNIGAQIMRTMDEEKNYAWDERYNPLVVKILFEGCAKYLGTVKKKGQTMGCQIRDIATDTFYFGAYVESLTSDDGEESFALTFTFNEDDMKDIPKKNIASLNDNVLHYTINDLALTNYGVSLQVVNGRDYLDSILCVTAQSIKDYLINNVDIDPALEFTYFFKATAEHDGDKVFIKITPYEILKQHVKEDALSGKVEEQQAA